MNATLEDVTKKKQEPTAEELAAEEMVRRARHPRPPPHPTAAPT
jgi:hypothetical protein